MGGVGGRRPNGPRASGLVAAIWLVAVGWLGAQGCSPSDTASPFTPYDAGAGADGGGGGAGGPVDAGPDADPWLGGPCTGDEQCADELDCTSEHCDPQLGRCRFVPDDASCDNGVYCDGVEQCEPGVGCTFGPPVTCSDGSSCTIDTCDEATRTCLSEPRDADGDGDPDGHCAGGGDCDDADPTISSQLPERCANGRDDDCDGDVDEQECVTPANDDCLEPLELVAPGSYSLSTAAATLDYGSSCAVSPAETARDVVAALLLDAGPPVDVQLTARTSSADVSVALFGQCGDPTSEITCSVGYPSAAAAGGRLAKLRARSIGDASDVLALPVIVTTSAGASVTLRYELLAATEAPTNETCGTALPLEPGVPTLVSLVGTAPDVASGCGPAVGDLVYQLELASPADVDLFATSLDGDGEPAISLRTAACALPEDEIACNLSEAAHLYRHGLPAGSYTVALSASAPTELLVTLELSAPSDPPPDEDCASPGTLVLGQTFPVSFAGHQDDVTLGCVAGAVDAAYGLELDEPSDVLLLGRYSDYDEPALELARPPCAGPQDLLVCATTGPSPLRARARNVAAGSYRVLAESLFGQPMEVTALVRPTVPATVVPFSDGCADALAVPQGGGFFRGTTANAQGDYSAGCDQGGQVGGGAPDQLLRLELSATKRVVLDMGGSSYDTLLDVRRGPACPGEEVEQGCAAGYYDTRSFLDLELAAGTYYLQIDGYGGEAGPWMLDVHVVDP